MYKLGDIIIVKKIFLDSNISYLNHNWKIGAKLRVINHPRLGEFYSKNINGYYVESAEDPIKIAYNESYIKHLESIKNNIKYFINVYNYRNFIHINCI